MNRIKEAVRNRVAKSGWLRIRAAGRITAAEFPKIPDHRGLVALDPTGAFAYLRLGRTFVLSGDKARARTAYRDLLTLWKDADPDIPVVGQAKAEYAKLI